MNKDYILKANHEIEELLKDKNSVGSKYYAVYYKKDAGDTKIAISVSKRLGKANVRNYQKRITKEILREMMPILEGFRMLIVVKTNSMDLSYEEKKMQLKYVLDKMISNNENKNRSKNEKQ